MRGIIVSFEELPTIVGREFLGEWWSVDRDRLALFDRASYVEANPFPFESDGYPDGLVEGFHALALLDHMMNPLLRITSPGAFGWNYGLDRARFVSPVNVADEIRLSGHIAAVRPKDSGYVISLDCTVEVKGRERPGFTARWLVFWLPSSPVPDGDGETCER